MGIVYEAEEESLGRHVALKVLPGQTLLDPQRLLRFRREAKAAARLHHTNIVPVFGVGEDDGLHYYVMQFIAGQGLDQVLAELRRLRKTRGGGAECGKSNAFQLRGYAHGGRHGPAPAHWLFKPDREELCAQEFAQVAEKATAVGFESPRRSRHFSREQDLARVREASALRASDLRSVSIALKSLAVTGLTRCRSKPISRDRRRSSSCPQPVTATIRALEHSERSRNRIATS